MGAAIGGLAILTSHVTVGHVSSIAIQGLNGEVLLVDAGPDLRSQMLACGIGRVDEILLTHAHADHVLGLDELRTVNRLLNKAIPAFATSATLDDVRARFAYAFEEPTPGFYRPALDARQVAAGTESSFGRSRCSAFPAGP